MVQIHLDLNFLDELVDHVLDRVLLDFLEGAQEARFLMYHHVHFTESALALALPH